jgi:hypothetical protein
MIPGVRYPDEQRVGTRGVRVWDVTLSSSLPSPDADELAQWLTQAVALVRRNTFGALGRDLALFDARVSVRTTDTPRHVEVAISYVPEGAIGDCVLIALWLPVRLLRVMYGVDQLQGVDAGQWKMLFL